ncbi:NUDIX hydrolase [Candidatus Wolfebacteria bacterium]|nr:NUDIX hydrolase [Candidatus Wolfebacteria bacterium]
MTYENYAVATLVFGPTDIFPMIMNLKGSSVLYWKFPEGRGKEGEAPEETAIRKVKEETGLIIKDRIALLAKRTRKTHVLYFFLAQTESFDTLIEQGEHGEYVEMFTEGGILRNRTFFGLHREFLEQIRDKYP